MEGPGEGLGDAGFEDLVREVQARMQGALDQQARLELLLDAVVTMAGDLSLDGVLARIVSIASRLVDAQYAALGVLGDTSDTSIKRLRTFIYHGIGADEAVEIGHLPRGHGLLGLIIDHPEPLRLHDIAEHPASYGFPASHPPMHSFLGVPVRIREHVFGNLYLSEKGDGSDFTAEDEEVVVALAAAAGVAIENARLYEEASRREDWLRATADIAARLADTSTGPGALQMVADRAREVARADVAWVVAGPSAQKLAVAAVSGLEVTPGDLAALSLDDTLAQAVIDLDEPLAVPDVSSDGRRASVAALPGWPEIGPAVVVPFGSSTATPGALALAWTHETADRHGTVPPDLPASFARQATLALQLAQAREDQQRLAVLEDRDRIGRDLHDLVIQRLFAVGLGLQGTARFADQAEVTDRLERAVDDIDATIKDIRRTIFALGTMESSDDIQAEVTRVVERAAATLKFRPELRFEGPVRTLVSADLAPDLLAVLGEALSNASRHARATDVAVLLTAGDEVALTVIDDGRGMGPDVVESGLANARRRAEQRGGTFSVESIPGEGTTLRWVVPR